VYLNDPRVCVPPKEIILSDYLRFRRCVRFCRCVTYQTLTCRLFRSRDHVEESAAGIPRIYCLQKLMGAVGIIGWEVVEFIFNVLLFLSLIRDRLLFSLLIRNSLQIFPTPYWNPGKINIHISNYEKLSQSVECSKSFVAATLLREASFFDRSSSVDV
jgi:hypothetical protein